MCEERERSIPAVALRGLVILPDMTIHFDLSRKKSITAVEQAMAGDQYLFVSAQRDMEEEDPGFEDLFQVGTLVRIRQVTKLPNSIIRVLVEGEKRARLLSLEEREDYLLARIEKIEEAWQELEPLEEEAMLRQLAELFLEYCKYYPRIGHGMEKQFQTDKGLERIMDLVTASMPLSYDSKQKVLELPSLKARFDFLTQVLYNEIEIARKRTRRSTY